MTSDSKRPSLFRALVSLEWHFLKHALLILVGVLPFTLAAMNTTGVGVAAVWGFFYLIAVAATTKVYGGLIWDAVMVALGHEARFQPMFERAFEQNKAKIEQVRAVLPKPILWFIEFLQIVNPLSLAGMLASVYLKLSRPSVLERPPSEAHVGRSDVIAYYETRRVVRRFAPAEPELQVG